MSKVVETKNKPEVTVVKTPVVTVVTTKNDPVPVKATTDKPAIRGFKKVDSESTEATAEEKAAAERTKANVELVSGLELENIRDVLLKDYYSYGRNYDKGDGEVASSLIINGEKIDPIITGIERNFNSLTFSLGGRRHLSRLNFRRGNMSHVDRMDVVTSFDVYLYKVKRPTYGMYNNGLMTGAPEISALTKKMHDEYYYQVLVLSAGTTFNITPEFKEPSPHNHSDNIWGGSYGVLVASRSNITDCLFFGINSSDNGELKDSTLFDSNIYDTDDRRTYLTSVDAENSIFDATTINMNGRNAWQRARIRKSDLLHVRYSGNNCFIAKSRLKEFNTGADSLTIKKSQISNIYLSTKEAVVINNTSLHSEEHYQYATGDSIKLDSVFDTMVARYTNGASIYLIRGKNNFWVGSNGFDSSEASMEIKTKNINDNPFLRYKGYNECSGDDYGLDAYLKRAVHQDLGDSELSRQIIDTIRRQIKERIAIASSIETSNKIRNSSENMIF